MAVASILALEDLEDAVLVIVVPIGLLERRRCLLAKGKGRVDRQL